MNNLSMLRKVSLALHLSDTIVPRCPVVLGVYMRLQGQEYWPQWPRHTVTTLGRVIIIITTHLPYTAPPHTPDM